MIAMIRAINHLFGMLLRYYFIFVTFKKEIIELLKKKIKQNNSQKFA
jgi:hypothetical protein